MKLVVVVPPSAGLKGLRLILFLIAIVCLGFFSFSYIYRTVYQVYEAWMFDHGKIRSVSNSNSRSTVTPIMMPDPDRGAGPAKTGAGIVGRISIPRLHISAMVEEGVDGVTLSRAVGHIPGTAFPGQAGNIGIAGHRDTFFKALKDLKPDDKIDFTTHSGHFRYTVESLSVVEPNNIGVLKATIGQTLTIVTCFPFQYVGSAPRRFIVHAVAH